MDAQPELLRRVIANLVQNAAKYSAPEEAVVVVLGTDAHGDVSLRVLDRGPGVSEAQIDRIFQPFVRSEGARSVTIPEVGLGLTLSERVIRSLGGRIWARRRKEGGMEFGFALPPALALEDL